MSVEGDDVPVWPSPEFTLSATTRKAKFEAAKADLEQRVTGAPAQQRALPDQQSKNGLGVAMKLVHMHQHRELLRRTRTIEFQKRTLQLRLQRFEFKKPRGRKNFYLKHVIPSNPSDPAYYQEKHLFRVYDDKDADVSDAPRLARGVLVGVTSPDGNTITVNWRPVAGSFGGTHIRLDMAAIEAGQPPYLTVSN